MLQNAPNLNHLWAGLIVEELVRNGAEWFCVCPGSRSTPLAWAVASHPEIKSIVHYDERGAAFHALGLAIATGKPAVFICTSGTAVANAFPAVVEASMAGVPLILLTADRPPVLQDAGANQTIDQTKIFGSYTRWAFTFVVGADGLRPPFILATTDHAWHCAIHPAPGPVHLNCMFDDPLAPVEEPEQHDLPLVLEESRHWLKGTAPYTQYERPHHSIAPDAAAHLADRLSNARRGVVLVGQLRTTGEREGAAKIVAALHWPMISDIASGLRLTMLHPLALPYAGHFASDLLNDADTILHLGGPVTSRSILEALDGLNLFETERVDYLRVTPAPGRHDPHHAVSHRLVCDVATLANGLVPRLPRSAPPEWVDSYANRNRAVDAVLREAFPLSDEVSEPAAAYLITRQAPKDHALFLGNSMPIRDADKYGCAEGNGATIVANRGASGIDGTIATAAGHARASGQPVTAVIGDLAGLHDLNSLALLRDLPAPFVLVIVNNDGGGIFHFLPVADYPEHFERFFGTPHGLGFEDAAAMYGLEYHRPVTNGALLDTYKTALGGAQSVIIEVRTNREANRIAHRELDARIRSALDKV